MSEVLQIDDAVVHATSLICNGASKQQKKSVIVFDIWNYKHSSGWNQKISWLVVGDVH